MKKKTERCSRYVSSTVVAPSLTLPIKSLTLFTHCLFHTHNSRQRAKFDPRTDEPPAFFLEAFELSKLFCNSPREILQYNEMKNAYETLARAGCATNNKTLAEFRGSCTPSVSLCQTLSSAPLVHRTPRKDRRAEFPFLKVLPLYLQEKLVLLRAASPPTPRCLSLWKDKPGQSLPGSAQAFHERLPMCPRQQIGIDKWVDLAHELILDKTAKEDRRKKDVFERRTPSTYSRKKER